MGRKINTKKTQSNICTACLIRMVVSLSLRANKHDKAWLTIVYTPLMQDCCALLACKVIFTTNRA